MVEATSEQLRLWEAGAAAGDRVAQYNLGVAYFHGLGVEQDPQRAAGLYAEAAALGDVRAKTCLGTCYYTGRGVAQDARRAAGLYAEAAALGDANAKTALGVCCAEGRGAERDPRRAAGLLLDAAAGGDEGAREFLSLGARALGDDGYYDDRPFGGDECSRTDPGGCGATPRAGCSACHSLVCATAIGAMFDACCQGATRSAIDVLRGYEVGYIDIPGAGAEVEIAGLTSAAGAKLNGMRGVINARPCKEGRRGVTVAPPHGDSAVKLENLCLPGSAGDECSICHGLLRALTQMWVVTPCRHEFHAHCLLKWAVGSGYERRDELPGCPLCRSGLRRGDVDGDDGPLWADPHWAAVTDSAQAAASVASPADAFPAALAGGAAGVQQQHAGTEPAAGRHASAAAGVRTWPQPARAPADRVIGGLRLGGEIDRLRRAHDTLARKGQMPDTPLLVTRVRATLRPGVQRVDGREARGVDSRDHVFVEFVVAGELTVTQKGDLVRQWKREFHEPEMRHMVKLTKGRIVAA